MANESTKCPMCGTKLKMMNGRMTCKKCGYYIRSQSGQDGDQAGGYNTSSGQTGYQAGGGYSASGTGQGAGSGSRQTSFQGGIGSPGSAGSSGSASRPNGSSGSGSFSGGYTTSKKSGETNRAVTVITSVILGIVSLAAIAGIVLFRTGALDNLLPGNDSGSSASGGRQEESAADRESDAEEITPASRGSVAADDPNARIPKSEFFRQVAEAIWGKSCKSITAQEYASLTALQLNRDEKVLYYQLDNGDTQSLTYQYDTGMDLSDLASFTGLEWLSVDDDLEKGDLDGLDSLYGVYAENTFDELAGIIPHPENITDLGVSDSIFYHTLNGIEAFPQLLYLDVDYESLEDISLLSQFPGLEGLNLRDCDDVSDYSALMNMTAMESLSIQSSQLKSIDFISQMPKLASLSIEGTKVSSLNALASCPELTYLSLADNTEIEDYSVVGQLTKLTQLELELNYGGSMPSLAQMPDLQWLSVKYAGDLTPLQDAVNVTYLSLERCSGWTLDSVNALQNLNTLIINDFSSYVESLEPLTHLPNLTALSLEDTSVFGNIEEIFGIPTLQYLYLDECQVGMDFDNIPTNETLELLSLNGITVLNDPTFNNGDAVKLSEHCDMFSHFPNLKELYLASLKLDSIDFVENLPLLQYLDITNNNVTSLKPLENLSDFRAVWCPRNTILENLPEDSDIVVITEE